MGDEDEAKPPEAKRGRRFRGTAGLAVTASAAVALTIGGVEAVPRISGVFSANGKQTTHSSNRQSGSGDINQQSGSGSTTQNGSNDSSQGGKGNTQVKGKGTAQKAGPQSNQATGNGTNQQAGPGSIQNGSGNLNIGGGAGGGTGGTGGTGGAGGTGGTGGQGGKGGTGGSATIKTYPLPAAPVCAGNAVTVSAPSTTGPTVSGSVAIKCAPSDDHVYYLIAELDNQGSQDTVNYYPKQEFTGTGTRAFTFNAQTIGSRKIFVISVDDEEAATLGQSSTSGIVNTLPGSIVSNVAVSTRTS